MKITKQQLKQIIKEEITQAIAEADELPEGWSGPDQSPLNLPPLPDAPAGPQQAYFHNSPGRLTFAVEAPGDEKSRVWRFVHGGAGNTPAQEWVLIYPSEQRDAESSHWRAWAGAAEKQAERIKKRLHIWLKEQDVAPEGGPGFEDAPWEEGKLTKQQLNQIIREELNLLEGTSPNRGDIRDLNLERVAGEKAT